MIEASNNPTKTRLCLALGIGLGISCDVLAWTRGPAVTGFALWVVMMAVAVCYMARINRTPNPVHILAFSVLAVCAAAVMALRAAPVFVPLMWLCMLLAAVMILVTMLQPKLLQLRFVDLFQALILTGLNTAFGILNLLLSANLQSLIRNPHTYAMMRGFLLLLPLLCIFVILFASADAVFDRYSSAMFTWLNDDLLTHMFRLGVFIWVISGLMKVLCHINLKPIYLPTFPVIPGKLEITIVLGGLAALFSIFVILQLSYLFGGEASLQALGISAAEYARRGFFELLTVVGLILSVLLYMARTGDGQARFKLLSIILILCILIIQVSAAQRLLLYIEYFGLTLNRVLASIVMLWLCLVTLCFSFTVVRGKPQGFVYTSISAGLVALLAFALLNPAALVTRTNIDFSIRQDQELDTMYLLSLGADAVPDMLEKMDQLPAASACRLATALLHQHYQTKGWRQFNLSHYKADMALTAHRPALEALIARFQPANIPANGLPIACLPMQFQLQTR